jgi:hypothetical protein
VRRVEVAKLAFPRQDDALSVMGEIDDEGLIRGISDDGADGERDDFIRPILAVAVVGAAAAAVSGAVVNSVGDVDEGPKVPVGEGDHVPAATPITTIGSPSGNVFLVAQAHGSVAA